MDTIKKNIFLSLKKLHKEVTQIYTHTSPLLRNLDTDFTLDNCLFGSAKLTENADPDKYIYTGYGIGFD